MNFTSTAFGLLKNFTSCLDPEQFPGLKPFEEKLAGLDLAALSDLVDPAKDPADDPSVDMKMGSGMTVRLYSDTIQEAAQPLLAEYLKVIREIRSDEELMKKEGYLDTYLGYMEETLDRALSDREDALDPYRAQMSTPGIVCGSMLTKIPHADEKNPAAEAFFGGMRSLTEYYQRHSELQGILQESPYALDDATYAGSMHKESEKCTQALSAISALKDEDIDSFGKAYCADAVTEDDEEAAKKVQEEKNDSLKDMAHSQAPAWIQSIMVRSFSEGNRVMTQTSEMLYELRFLITSSYKDDEEDAVKPEDMPGEAGKTVRGYKSIAGRINEALGKGFKNALEEEKFISSLMTDLRELEKGVKAAETESPEGLSEEDAKKFKAAREALSDIGKSLLPGKSVVRRLEDQLDPMTSDLPGETHTELGAAIKPLQEMMEKTGESWPGHEKNSAAYTAMMASLKKVTMMTSSFMESTEKQGLRMQLRELEKCCEAYLGDKAEERTSEQEKDRYAGALGILNALNPGKAQKYLKEAQEARKDPELTIDSIVSRANPFYGAISPEERYTGTLEQCVGAVKWNSFLEDYNGACQGDMAIPNIRSSTVPASRFYMYLLAKTDLTAEQVMDIGRLDKKEVARHMDDFIKESMALKDKTEEQRTEYLVSLQEGAAGKLKGFSFPDKELPQGKEMRQFANMCNTFNIVCKDIKKDAAIYKRPAPEKKEQAPEKKEAVTEKKEQAPEKKEAKGKEGVSETIDSIAPAAECMANLTREAAYGFPSGPVSAKQPAEKSGLLHLLKKIWDMLRGKNVSETHIPHSQWQNWSKGPEPQTRRKIGFSELKAGAEPATEHKWKKAVPTAWKEKRMQQAAPKTPAVPHQK